MRVVVRLISDQTDRWVSPFGNLGVKGCSHLTQAYRSVPRPSSPVYAKASTNCPYLTLEKSTPPTTTMELDRRRRCRASTPGALQTPGERPSQRLMRGATAQLDNLLQRHAFLPLGRCRPPRRNHAATASISRTHSQCQKRSLSAPNPQRQSAAKLMSSSLECTQTVLVERIGIEPMTSSLQS